MLELIDLRVSYSQMLKNDLGQVMKVTPNFSFLFVEKLP